MSRTSLRACAGIGLAALLGACATVGPDFKPPVPPASTGYAMAGDAPTPQAAIGAQVADQWQELFASPEIDQTVRQAIAGNRSLESARASLAQANEAIGGQAARASLDATATVAEDRVNLKSFGFSQFPGPNGPISLSNPTFQYYSFGLSGRYDLDLFGGRRREHETLAANAEAQALQTDAAYLTLTAQVVGQAIDIASLRAQIVAQQEVVRSDRENLDLVTKAFNLGGGTRLDVATVQTELAGDQGMIPMLQQRLAAARHALALLVGQAPDQRTPPDFDLDRIAQPSPIPVTLPAELAHARPDIRAAEARLHAATARIGVATADLYPKLELNGSLAQSALRPADLFSYDATGFLLGPTLTVPLFREGELKAKKRSAEDAARQALADYQQTVLKAFVQVADSLQAVAHDDEAVTLALQGLQSATDSLRLQRLRYRDGKAGLLPVLDAQRSYGRASSAAIQARARRLQDTAALLYATSRAWSAKPLTAG